MISTAMVPTEIQLHRRSGILELGYEDGTRFKLRAEYLRVYAPSADVQGHSPDQAVLQVGKKDVGIKSVEPQGNYALRIRYSDGHDAGIYTWDYLYDLGAHESDLWQIYLERLEKAGKHRGAFFIAKSSD